MSSSKVHVSANLLLKHFKSNFKSKPIIYLSHLKITMNCPLHLATICSNKVTCMWWIVDCCFMLYPFFFFTFSVNSNSIQVTFTLELNQFLDIVNIFLISVNLFGHTYRYLLTFFIYIILFDLFRCMFTFSRPGAAPVWRNRQGFWTR